MPTMGTTPDEVVRQLQQIPAAPRVLPPLKRLLSDGNSSIHDVVTLIRLDPGIAARVLKIGNSAYYSHGQRCYTVEEAVHRVGYDNVYELVANAVASQVLVRPLDVYGIEADELWRMSAVGAMAAEAIAEHLQLDRDIAYTAGLLHGLGLVAIDVWAFLRHPELRFNSGPLPVETSEAERHTLGFDNAETGAALLRLWEFPAAMSEPIRWQYQPLAAGAHMKLSVALHLAKYLRTAVCTDALIITQPAADLLRCVGLNAATMEMLLARVQTELQSIRSLLEVESPVRTIVEFPSGRRTIEGVGNTRSGMEREV